MQQPPRPQLWWQGIIPAIFHFYRRSIWVLRNCSCCDSLVKSLLRPTSRRVFSPFRLYRKHTEVWLVISHHGTCPATPAQNECSRNLATAETLPRPCPRRRMNFLTNTRGAYSNGNTPPIYSPRMWNLHELLLARLPRSSDIAGSGGTTDPDPVLWSSENLLSNFHSRRTTVNLIALGSSILTIEWPKATNLLMTVANFKFKQLENLTVQRYNFKYSPDHSVNADTGKL